MPTNSIDDRKTCEEAPPPAVQPLPPGVGPGSRVLVRGSAAQLVSIVEHSDCRELHLFNEVPGRLGDRWVLLWPFDRPVRIDQGRRVRVVRPRAWAVSVIRALRPQTDPATPRCHVAAADVIPYQLAPAVAVAAGAARILLADEVGLGKTVQAGWIVSDLCAREHDVRILLAVPAGLRLQWRDELSKRFAVPAIVADARWLREMVADLPPDVGPWAAPGVYLTSLDFLKRPDVAASLAQQIWDLLVVDEAHTAAAPTDRHAALAAIARRARRVVSITATPFAGDMASFASMAALGAAGASAGPLLFRRSRADIGDSRARRHRFVSVRLTRAEGRLQRLLERYSRDVWQEATGDVEGARLAMTLLRKRALSSAAAVGRTLQRRMDLLQGRGSLPRQLQLFEDDDIVDDDVPGAVLAIPGLADAAREQRWIAALVASAAAAAALDSKQRFLRRLLARTPRESVIVFTEYRDTLVHLATGLPAALHLHGGMSSGERAAVQAQFNESGGLMLATDAAAEGLNLHGRCRLVVNYELPWNPARLEQRIGRIDRIGQQRTVHALTLAARDTAEDLVIANLVRRLSRVVASLGGEDRLAGFLNEARTARIVIGGAPLEDGPAESDCVDLHVVKQPAVAARALAAAECLRAPARCEPRDILVSSTRASASLPAGCVVVVRCVARTPEGQSVAERPVALLVPGSHARPRDAVAARALASTILAAVPDVRSLAPEISAWFEDACRVHAEAVDRMAAREMEMRDRPSGHVEVQPGLFDRRALQAAGAAQACEAATRAAHERRLAALGRTRVLGLDCAPTAVLVSWR
jgi:superfamily II DNA or RNA helicase